VKPFSEEEQADRRRPWQKREGLRRIAVFIAAPTGLYALLVLISLLGGPRIGSSLIPLPNPGGVSVVSPVAGPPASRQPTRAYPPVSLESVTPAPKPTTPSPGEPRDPGAAKSTGLAPGSTTTPQGPQTTEQPAWQRTPGDRPAPTNRATTAPTDPPATTTPPPRPTPPPTTPSDLPGNPDNPQPPTLADTLVALLHQLGL
jgi:hypothetical protein